MNQRERDAQLVFRETMSELKPWQGHYRKCLYLLKDIDGQEYYCWPNDGKMMALDGSGYYWTPKDDVLIREASWSEMFKDYDTEMEDMDNIIDC